MEQGIFVANKVGSSSRPGFTDSLGTYASICTENVDSTRYRLISTSEIAVDDSVPDSERSTAVVQALGRLPEKQRTAIVLCTFEGWTNRQAAEVLRVSVEAVESLLSRARRTLREDLSRFREVP